MQPRTLPKHRIKTHLDELLVVGLVAVLREHAQLGLPLLDGARRLVQAPRQAVVRQRLLQHLLRSGGVHNVVSVIA